jgi:hypothetical protein
MEPNDIWQDCWIQRLDGAGNPLWGPEGVLVAGVPGRNERYAVVTHGSQGDAYIVWEDHRPPYTDLGALFAQHFDANGIRLWNEDLFICVFSPHSKVIPDGQGGFILQGDPGGGMGNAHWRIDYDGNILWQRTLLSWGYWAGMVPGEPGYCYLGFSYEYGAYGQRVRISDGSNMWPTYGSGQAGALMAWQPGWPFSSSGRIAFRYPYLYGVFAYLVHAISPDQFYCQVLDTLGNRMMGDNGLLMCSLDISGYQMVNCVADGLGGVILVYSQYPDAIVCAKRADMNGTLGGWYPPLITTTLQGNDILLTWNPDTLAVTYSVYKSSDPYIFPPQAIAVTADTFYVDENAIMEEKGYYRIIWEGE